MIESIIESIFGSRRKKIKSAPHRIRLSLEALEDRVVPSYIWSAPNTAVDAQFKTPGNWFNTNTGTFATTAPDSNTDCIFSAASPTTCIDLEGSYCRSITTDSNWHGTITANSNGLHIVRGTSLIEGGTFSSGGLYIIGGTLDYDAPNLNDNTVIPSGTIRLSIGLGATFKVDKNCLQIKNTDFWVGDNNTPGTLILNTNTQLGPNTSIYTSPLGKVIPFTPPTTLVWNGTTNTKWNNPNNWIDPSTGQVSTSAPGSNTDCIFSATSPTACTVTGDTPCKSITTDANWNGDIDVSGSVLYVYGGTSTIKGGTITSNNVDGTIEVNGGTFDYDGQNINETSLSKGGFLSINIDNNASFIVDKNCVSTSGGMNIDAHFKVGFNVDGRTTSPGMLTFNTPSRNSGTVVAIVSNRINVEVSPQGTVVFAPNSVLTSRLSDQVNGLDSLGTVIINDGVVLALRKVSIRGGIFETASSGSATIGESYGTGVYVSNATVEMNSNQGNYFQLTVVGFFNLGDTSILEYHVDGTKLGASNRITVKQDDATEKGFFLLSGYTTSVCKTDGSQLSVGNHNYTIVDTTSTLFSGQFNNFLWEGDQPTTWQTAYQSNGFNLSGTILPPVHNFVWSPGPNTDSLWTTASNWFDTTTSATATFAPNAYTDVNFNAVSAWEYCRVITTYVTPTQCRSIHIAPGPNHLLDLSSATLDVFGVNGADSDIEGGEIDCVTGSAGKLQLNGGNFTYNTATLNHPYVYPSTLTVIVQSGGGTFTTGPALVTVYNTNYDVGYSHTGTGDGSSMIVNTANLNFVNSTILVDSQATLTLNPSARLSNAAITSSGNVVLNNGSMILNSGSSPSGVMITGGTLQDKGLGFIQGNLLVYNASLQMVEDSNMTSMLLISGNLTMINSSFSFNVFSDMPNVSDRVAANTITLFGNCTSNCTTKQISPAVYTDFYQMPMYTFTGQFNGTFSNYNWLGTGKVWTPQYTNGQYRLLG